MFGLHLLVARCLLVECQVVVRYLRHSSVAEQLFSRNVCRKVHCLEPYRYQMHAAIAILSIGQREKRDSDETADGGDDVGGCGVGDCIIYYYFYRKMNTFGIWYN